MAPTIMDAERYVGMPYLPGEFDCGSLVVLVQREIFGRPVAAVPARERQQGMRGQARDIRATLERNVTPVDGPETGAVALFWETTAHGRPPLNRRWHVGVVFMHYGAPWILHCANEAHGTVLDTLQSLQRQGLHLDGWYGWKDPPPR
jgi:hypothetical protein